MDSEFITLDELENQAGRPAILTLLGQHRRNVNETVALLSAMKDAIDIGAVRMTAHRMRGACGSLGFHRISDLFAMMCKAAEQDDSAQIAGLIEEVEKENAQLEGAVRERYPELHIPSPLEGEG